MLRLVPALITLGLLSCEEVEPIACEAPPPPAPPSESSSKRELAAAQLTLAEVHLQHQRPAEALAYLDASIRSHPAPEARSLFKKTFNATTFSIPTLQLDHPFPVLHHLHDGGKNLYVALGGEHPTVVRWSLDATPAPQAILFPQPAPSIQNIALSPTTKHLLVNRGSFTLLCHADSLQPIAELGCIPDHLKPAGCQPFSENGLLLAHPIRQSGSLVWHIRDTATGESLRSESLPLYPKPVSAVFHNTTLQITLEDLQQIQIPLSPLEPVSLGTAASLPATKASSSPFVSLGSTITHHHTLAAGSMQLLEPLTGLRLNASTQKLAVIPLEERLKGLSESFGGIPETFQVRSAEAAVLSRLASAFPDEHPVLSATDRVHAGIISNTFEAGDPAAISAVIRAAPSKGLPIATALKLSLQSKNPEFIILALEKAENLPPALQQLAMLRLAQLGKTTPSDPRLPELAHERARQDWAGYEAPDFAPILALIRDELSTELGDLTLPENAAPEQVEELLKRFLDPSLLQSLGSRRLAGAAITAARELAKAQAHATYALQFTSLAQRFGGSRAEALRIQALAFTTLADFKNAHRTWLDLITNEDEARHFASDYAEAAHTAFETGAAPQAMEILDTGLFRFPNDTPFAIRAGWIALLTEHPAEAAKYLLHATKLGLPPHEIENTSALLAIAHTQLGDPESAITYMEQLTAINPEWSDPGTIEALTWPEPLKASLRQLVWQP